MLIFMRLGPVKRLCCSLICTLFAKPHLVHRVHTSGLHPEDSDTNLQLLPKGVCGGRWGVFEVFAKPLFELSFARF